jgi:phosphoglycolate phosphatase-like HAD superfamily hydrolase
MGSSPPLDGRLKGVIFDLDGTLTDTLPVAFSAFRAAVARFSDRSFTDEELIAFFGPAEDGILQRLLPQDWEACLQCYLEEYAKRHVICSAPFPGMQEALDLLRSCALPLAIVTGKTPAAVEITLRHVNIRDYFEAVETGSAAGGTKPAAIRKLAAKWNLDPSQVAYVGDARSDMEAAKEVGAVAVGAGWAATATWQSLRDAGADVVFPTVDEFTAWLRTLCKVD